MNESHQNFHWNKHTTITRSNTSPPHQMFYLQGATAFSDVVYASFTTDQNISFISTNLSSTTLNYLHISYTSTLLTLLNSSSLRLNCNGSWASPNLTEICDIAVLRGFVPSINQLAQRLASPLLQSSLDLALVPLNITATVLPAFVASNFSPTGENVY